MKIYISILVGFLLPFITNSQNQISEHINRCGTDIYIKNLVEKYPEYKNSRDLVNEETIKWINNNPNKLNSIITIPVVVHIVWNTNQQNISDAQIFSQIDVLNNDYRRTNSDAINTPSIWSNIAADCEIEFCLADVDPNGNFTTGITRTQTSQNSFSIQSDGVKSNSNGGIDPWPQDDYLNIWVCNLSGGILGYATPPSNFNNPDDGVVIGYRYFGTNGTAQSPYNKGRTCTHEVGHWLNLDHVWGYGGNCGTDNVNDTPTQEEENYGCPSFPHNPNSCNTSNANGDMYMNYMDYTNDACMNMFTNGQKNRMISAINQYRSNLLNHNLCSNSPPNQSWNCVNGNCIDPNNGNGTYSDYNVCISNCNCGSVNTPINQDFQINNLPNNWTIVNIDNDKTWQINEQTGYNSSKSIYINNADYPANGTYDDLILPSINLTNLSSASLSFNYAYTLWTNPTTSPNWSDTLIILISEDCGINWSKIWEKAGQSLVTSSAIFNAFSWTPANNNDWSYETISLSNYLNQDDIVIKFRNVNQYENNLFLDNINITSTPNSIEDKSKLIYPNPVSSEIFININGRKEIYDLIGNKIIEGDNNKFDLSLLNTGIYILKINNQKIKIFKN